MTPEQTDAEFELSGDGTSDAARSALSFVATRPVAITMLMIALGVFGLVSFAKLPVDLLPEISYPTLTVRTTFPGAAPEDVEDRLSVRLQEALATLPNLIDTTSISRAGTSDVLLEFDWGTEMTFAVQEVRDRLDGVFLPGEADKPLILRYDPNLDPILRFGVAPPEGVDVTDEETLIRLRWLADKRIKRELEGITGVAAVQVRGGMEEEIRVRVDPFRMAALDLDPGLIGQRLAQENLNASGGQIREGSTDYLVRTLNEFKSVEEIRDLAIARVNDAVIRVRDIAQVDRTHAEREVITKLNGREAVEIAIYREAGANIVDIAERVRNAVVGSEEQQRLAEENKGKKSDDIQWSDRSKLGFLGWKHRDEASLELLSDQSTFIADAVNEVKQSALLGALFAVIVMWLFLRKLSATLIIAVAIPISVVVTFAPMFLMDVSLNIMSLGGLALGVGMLVDNAIVVLESITRCREEGDSLADAAVRGVAEVAGAITASTLTTVSVFAPIVFVQGIAGQIFGDQAVTVVSSLLVSLLVAVLFIPMLASRKMLAGESNPLDAFRGRRGGSFLREFYPRREGASIFAKAYGFIPCTLMLLTFLVLRAALLILMAVGAVLFVVTWPFKALFDLLWRAVDAIYPQVLRFSLSAPLLILVGVGFLGWYASERAKHLGLELIPEVHQGEFTAFLALPVGTPIEESEQVYSALEKEVRRMERVNVTSLTVGVEKDTLTREIEDEHTARLTVRLKPDLGSDVEDELIFAVRSMVTGLPEMEVVDVRRPTPFALDAAVAVEIKGWDLADLEIAAQLVADRLESVPGLSDVRSTVRPGYPEARVTFDRDKTLAYDLDLSVVSNYVRDQVLGSVSTRFVDGDDRIDVRVRGDEVLLGSIDDVAELIVNPTAERPVPLSAVATITRVQGPAEIRRIGGQRAVLVTAASSGDDVGGLNDRVQVAIDTLMPPGDVTVELGGQKRELDEGTRSLYFALLLAIFLVYVVMACQFESLVQPFVILFSVPLAGVGAVLLLDALSVPLSVVVFIGLILLAGIVVNNAIVLVDRINQKRIEGLLVRDAILEAGRARLRPILMTTATTVLGLVPLTGWLLGIPGIEQFVGAEGAELRAPMAIAVIGGLTSSTLLTLLVIPVVYSLLIRDRKPAEVVA
ncbi:MAG: HAE1 family hydrophobic/amphiphilic exporter-1 [Paracoccaceae bacterium]|jgi:HAE1 family hydrophobic/amphiphilic exporter-1